MSLGARAPDHLVRPDSARRNLTGPRAGGDLVLCRENALGAAIIFGFTAGLVFDALSSTALGLRAGVYTAVAFIAIRTIDRMDSSPLSVALWVGLLTISGVVLFLLVGTIFGQVTMDMGEAMRRVILVPLYNLVVALLLAPLSTRLLAPARHRFI